MEKQICNPILPLNEYVPDGEPHVFGNRIYLFGSHDVAGGTRYCQAGDYVCYSAPVEDLTDWKYEGIIYRADQDPEATEDSHDLYAPDVVHGNDGRFYLYYNVTGPGADGGFHNNLSVAVSEKPAGPYEYLGFVRNEDGTPYRQYLLADPAVINDEGVIRLYYGWSLSMVSAAAHGSKNATMPDRERLLQAEMMMFKRSREELESYKDDIMGANTVELKDDMLTVKGKAHRIVPGQFRAQGTSFEGHAFYEASSIRKINGAYYFIYSSENSNELCYATSRYPDKEFVYGGILNSNGDVGFNGRAPEDRVNMTANNHGSVECINGQWFIFYHRQTNRSTFSRQACAEKIQFLEDGSFLQAECTSSGMNDGPLSADREYPAAIACNITNGRMPHITNRMTDEDIPYVTESEGEHYIANIKEGTKVGYKYLEFNGKCILEVRTRGTGSGYFEVFTEEGTAGRIPVSASEEWKAGRTEIFISGKHALFFCYHGTQSIEWKTISFGSDSSC